MRHLRKKLFSAISLCFMIAAPLTFSAGVLAAPVVPLSIMSTTDCSGGFSQSECSACDGISQLGAGQDCSTGGSDVNNIISDAVDILSFVVGIIAVIMIIISGIKFATAGGDSQSVANARSTLMWAIIGLVVVALAQVIVHLALSQSNHITSNLSNKT